MIRLTVARYYTPTGRSIQKPYEKGNLEAYNRDFTNRFNHGELFAADSIHFPDSLRYTTLVNKRTVYGGGGIMPDYFVPVDTTMGTALHAHLYAKGVINRLSISEVDNHRSALLEKYPDIATYKAHYRLPKDMMLRIKEEAEKEKIAWNDEEFEKSKELISLQLRSLMARDLYGSSAFFELINGRNDIFNEGVKIIEDEHRYKELLRGRGSNVGKQI